MSSNQQVGEVQGDEECLHEFVAFRPDCQKCGAPYIALAATGKQQVGENPAWRDELVREAHSRGLMEGLNSPRPQQVGEVQGDAPNPGAITGSLRAMVRNYSEGHRWDHLDARMCAAAADRIESLEEALAARQPGAQVPADRECALRKARLALAEQCEWGSEKRACLSGEIDSSPAMKALVAAEYAATSAGHQAGGAGACCRGDKRYCGMLRRAPGGARHGDVLPAVAARHAAV